MGPLSVPHGSLLYFDTNCINTRFPELAIYRLEADRWVAVTYGQDETVRLESIAVDLKLSEIYRDMEWDTDHLS